MDTGRRDQDMAGSPRFKIYTEHHGYEASAKHAEVAAMIAACLGEGSTVRDRPQSGTLYGGKVPRRSAHRKATTGPPR